VVASRRHHAADTHNQVDHITGIPCPHLGGQPLLQLEDGVLQPNLHAHQHPVLAVIL
jgi:hypothetical protein